MPAQHADRRHRVTGTRTPVEIESSPVSSALVSRQELEHRDIHLIDKAIEGVPGVISLRARGASDNDFGLGLRGFAGRGGQVRTLILLDDQPINNSFNGSVNWSMFSPRDLQRVEIARGPFSSLYGGNAMGGVINLISRKPDGRHGDFFYQYGSRATNDHSVHLTDRYFDRLGLTFGYLGGLPSGYDNWSFDTRIDYDITSKQRLSYVLAIGDFSAMNLANTNWGGLNYTAPNIIPPSGASQILNTGNYLNSSGAFVTASSSPGYADPYLSGRAPQVVFYNAGVQRLITNDLMIAINYAGSQAHFINPSGANGRGYWSNNLDPIYLAGLGGLSSATSANSPLLDAPATQANIDKAIAAMPGIKIPYPGVPAAAAKNSRLTISQMLKAFPQYSGVSDTWGQNIANISYNALQISLVQRSWRGLSYTLNYTYSQNVGDDGNFRSGYALPSGVVSGSNASFSQNRIDRSPNTQSVPQSVSAYGVWHLPFGKDHIGANNFYVRSFAGGWQLSGIYTYSGGSPFAITTSGCRSEVGSCIPDLNPTYRGSGRLNGSYGSKNTGSDFTSQYLDPNAFESPQNLFTSASPVYLIGNAPRTHAYNLEAPGKYNLDMGVKRSFDLVTEKVKFIFEANCLNVTHKHTFTGLTRLGHQDPQPLADLQEHPAIVIGN